MAAQPIPLSKPQAAGPVVYEPGKFAPLPDKLLPTIGNFLGKRCPKENVRTSIHPLERALSGRQQRPQLLWWRGA